MPRIACILLLLAAITLAVYWPATGYDYVRYDDPLFFVDNPYVQNGLSWKSVDWALFSVVVANWHPVTTLSFVLTHQLFGTNAAAEHLVNILFHAANAMLLFLVLLQMTSRRSDPSNENAEIDSTPCLFPCKASDAVWRCAMVAAVFALHPLRVESVAWISERKDVLCGFFMLLTLWAWARYAGKAEGNPFGAITLSTSSPARTIQWSYWLALTCFALSLMSKAMAVTLPFILLLLEVWPLRRIQWTGAGFKNWRQAVLEKWPFFALSGVFCGLTYSIQKNYAAMVTLERLGWTDRISNAISSYLQYLVKLFWPVNMAVIYPYSMNAAPDWEIWNIGLLLVAISILCLCMLPRKPYLAVGWFWYLGTSIPIIGLVQVGETAMADRYTYLPLIGPVIALIWLISDMGRSKILQKKLLGGTAIVVLVALAILTRQQLHYWKNTVSLFEHAIEVTGANASAQSGLGIALEKEGRTREAMIHYRISLALNPEDFQTYYNLGQLLVQREDWGEAEKLFFNVLYRNPDDFNAHLTLGMVLPYLGRDLEARKHLETALNLQPDSTEALNNLAWSLATSDDPELRNGTRAVMLAERACELTHYEKTRVIGTLAAAYAEAGRYEEAIATAEKACAQARKNNESDLFQKNLELLRLYRSEQPCRDLPAKVAPDKR